MELRATSRITRARRGRRSAYAFKGALASAAVVALTQSACSGPGQLDWQDDSEGPAGMVLAVAVDGSDEVVARAHESVDGQFAIDVVEGGSRRSVPVVNGPQGYARTAELHSLAVKDGSIVAVGGVRAGAHGNVRWVVWQGTTAGLNEQPQSFETFGGWGAGDLVGAAIGDGGPLIVGSWTSPTGRGMDVTSWIPHGPRWLRSTESVIAAATESALPSASAATAHGALYIVAGSITHLGERTWRGPALWYSHARQGPWQQLELPMPDHVANAEASAIACTAEHCAAAGWADDDAAYWSVTFQGADAIAPTEATIVRGKARAGESREARLAVVTTLGFDLVAVSDGPVTHTMSVEGGLLDRTSDVPGSLTALVSPPSSLPQLVTEWDQHSRGWQLAAPDKHRATPQGQRPTS